MNKNGSFVTRPKWLRIKEAEDLIAEMDSQWVFPEIGESNLLKPPIVKKKRLMRFLWNRNLIVEFDLKNAKAAFECFSARSRKRNQLVCQETKLFSKR